MTYQATGLKAQVGAAADSESRMFLKPLAVPAARLRLGATRMNNADPQTCSCRRGGPVEEGADRVFDVAGAFFGVGDIDGGLEFGAD